MTTLAPALLLALACSSQRVPPVDPPSETSDTGGMCADACASIVRTDGGACIAPRSAPTYVPRQIDIQTIGCNPHLGVAGYSGNRYLRCVDSTTGTELDLWDYTEYNLARPDHSAYYLLSGELVAYWEGGPPEFSVCPCGCIGTWAHDGMVSECTVSFVYEYDCSSSTTTTP